MLIPNDNDHLPRFGIATQCPCGHSPGMHKCCPSCLISVDGEDEIDEVFGFRRMGDKLVPQPLCRACRAQHAKDQRTFKRLIALAAAELGVAAEVPKVGTDTPEPVELPEIVIYGSCAHEPGDVVQIGSNLYRVLDTGAVEEL